MIRSRFLFSFLLITISIIPFSLKAQYTDFKMRFGLEVEKEIIDNLDAHIELEQRYMHNISSYDKTFIEPSLSYDLSKHFSVGVIWRIQIRENNSYKMFSEQRYSAFVKYDVSYLDFKIKLRTILQYGFDDITNAAFSVDQKLINRNSIDIDYDWFGKKIKPGIKFELFHHLNHPHGSILNQWRLKAGASYILTNHSEINLYYMFENEFNVVKPVDAHIIGLKYGYSF
ncbi:DUF2490 domain-containing protein [Saccharicrinis sp. FJH54]|uniref:DUF2490 domain-containing protein n=1 Tax=Saccharicrinis sp. FJH54 TaxID=3344665 RepID=UPI0035D42BD7